MVQSTSQDEQTEHPGAAQKLPFEIKGSREGVSKQGIRVRVRVRVRIGGRVHALPGEHGKHIGDPPPLEKVPAGHGMHCAAPAKE